MRVTAGTNTQQYSKKYCVRQEGCKDLWLFAGFHNFNILQSGYCYNGVPVIYVFLLQGVYY